MSNDTQVPSTSKDTDAKLVEMKEMGIINDDEGLLPETKEEPKEEPKEEIKEPETKEPETKEPETLDKKEEIRPQERTPQYVPVNKYNELRHSIKDLKSELEDYKSKYEEISKQPTAEIKTSIDEISSTLAEKHGLDQDFVKDLMSETTRLSTPQIPDDVKVKLDLLDQQAQVQSQLKAFEEDYQKVSDEFGDLTEADKKEIQRLAFTRGYETTPIRTLAIQYKYENPKKETVEGSGGGRSNREILDLDNMSEEDLEKLDPNSDAFEQFRQRGKQKSGWNRA